MERCRLTVLNVHVPPGTARHTDIMLASTDQLMSTNTTCMHMCRGCTLHASAWTRPDHMNALNLMCYPLLRDPTDLGIVKLVHRIDTSHESFFDAQWQSTIVSYVFAMVTCKYQPAHAAEGSTSVHWWRHAEGVLRLNGAEHVLNCALGH
eukprot:jgi/Ulvmu1/8781/UM048_0036.1